MYKNKTLTASPYHLVEMSPWPILASMSALGLTMGSMMWWHYNSLIILWVGVFNLMMVSFGWWSDVMAEKKIGFHNSVVCFGFRFGMVLFMVSEVLFFFSFFWSYFHKCWGPQLELGYSWPPKKFKKIVVDPFSIPLLKTVLLLSSGVSVTWAHHCLLNQKFKEAFKGLLATMLLGSYFLILQMSEYSMSLFSLNSMMYGSVFFMLTGFHGMHVTVGTMFLMVCLFRTNSLHFSSSRHVGFEAAAWYWHFVDVVWLFLYFFLYWYGYSL